VAKVKLTKRVVDAAQPSEVDTFVWDSELAGFGLKVTPTGRKVYLYQYRARGVNSTSRVTIGRHGSPFTVDAARKEAEELAYVVKRGGNPQQQRKARAAEASTLAFDAYVDRFVADYLPVNQPSSGKEAARLLKREAVPFFRSTPIDEIRKRDVTALMDKLRGKQATARNTAGALRTLFGWAAKRGDIETSPMNDMELPKKVPHRERFLSDEEIGIVWRASLRIRHPYSSLVRALLICGQRRDEVAEMPWEELDLEGDLWSVPAQRMKAKRAHTVALTSMMKAEIDAQPAIGEFVFSVSGKKPIANWSYSKRKLDKEVRKLAIEEGVNDLSPWRLHDLRRTVSTGMQRLGIDRVVIERVAARKEAMGSGEPYNRYDFSAERREALQRWTDHLATIVAPSQAS